MFPFEVFVRVGCLLYCSGLWRQLRIFGGWFLSMQRTAQPTHHTYSGSKCKSQDKGGSLSREPSTPLHPHPLIPIKAKNDKPGVWGSCTWAASASSPKQGCLTIFTAGPLPVVTASGEGDAGTLVGNVRMRLLRGKVPPVPFMGHHVVRYLFNLTRSFF